MPHKHNHHQHAHPQHTHQQAPVKDATSLHKYGRWACSGELKRRNIAFSQYVNLLKRDKFYCFLRFGDGEWWTIFRTTGRIMGQQPLSTKTQRDMRRGLIRNSKSSIIFGMQNYALRTMGDRIGEFLRNNKLLHIVWTEADTFHYASRDGKLFPFVQQLRNKKTVIIGPRYLRPLKDQAVDYLKFIEVPQFNAYGKKQEIEAEILATQEEFGDGLVYNFSTGPAANIFMFDLWKKMSKNFFIDLGSLWDVFCGKRSRRYMNKRNYNSRILKKNLNL